MNRGKKIGKAVGMITRLLVDQEVYKGAANDRYLRENIGRLVERRMRNKPDNAIIPLILASNDIREILSDEYHLDIHEEERHLIERLLIFAFSGRKCEMQRATVKKNKEVVPAFENSGIMGNHRESEGIT